MPRPKSVRVIRTLGSGRAARAQLVDAELPCGSTVRCVEKVFAPGRLTRWIYRAAFAAPFAYQTNRHAILASFFRRRVAAAVLASSDIDVGVATPLYVRFCDESKAWVLAAEWIDGRGICPLEVDRRRIRRWLGRESTRELTGEIHQLVGLMGQVETKLTDSGLTGSGWQVAPRAMVSTANLLRHRDRYTVIDLESGIPAILVPKYILAGLRSATAPPFDDLDPDGLRDWLKENESLLTFRLGPAAVDQLAADVEQLIDHDASWKASELAPLRRPSRLLRPGGLDHYQASTVERWQQDDIVDEQCAAQIKHSRLIGRAIWWSLWLPSIVGVFIARLIGRQQTRHNTRRWFSNRLYRRSIWNQHIERCQQDWVESGRIANSTAMTTPRYLVHRGLSWLPRSFHRVLTDAYYRSEIAITGCLLLFSGRYQTWLGQQHIWRAIDRWVQAKRMQESTASHLLQVCAGNEVRVYARGFGMHLALKFLAPVVIPAKIGGVMAFVASGNVWFLLPLAATPMMRMLVTLANWFQSRTHHVRHREALAVSWLPFIGSIAFPLQMYAARPELSTFLIRDAASRLGRKLPIYGGRDSRTELAFIRSADLLVEALDIATDLTGARKANFSPRIYRGVVQDSPRTKLGRWLAANAEQRIEQRKSVAEDKSRRQRIAA